MGKTCKIQLIEANPRHGQAITRQLETQGFVVEMISTVIEAREKLHKTPGDLLIIDINISPDQFFVFYSWLSGSPHLAPLPRLFITGDLESPISRRLIEEEKEEVLGKPIESDRFIFTIEKLLVQGPRDRVIRDEDYLLAMIGRRVGSVVIEEDIGRGGMGAVFKGRQESLNRRVAVKLLLPSMVGDAHAARRFRREAIATARLKSPHIVQIYDFGEIDQHAFYIIMEYLAGKTIEQYLRVEGKFPLSMTVEIISQVARGLLIAHDAGLVHRDIKPSNLIMSSDGHVTITDFGLVRSVQHWEQTQSGMIVGTPHYLPPEQAAGKPLDARSDIYALGIVFYQLLVGMPPFIGNNTVEVMMKHINQPLPDPRLEIPELPARVTQILNLMTAKAPMARYPNCRELLKELSSLGEDQTHPAVAIGPAEEGKPAKKSAPLVLSPAFSDIFAELENLLPSLFQEEKLQGTIMLSQSGTFNQQGKFPEGWLNTLCVLKESTKQINNILHLGQWRFEILKTQESLVTLFPLDDNLGAFLMDIQESMSSSAVLKRKQFLWQEVSTLDPLQQISSVAGVQGVLLFNSQGELRDYRLKKPGLLDILTAAFSSLTYIFQSIPLGMTSMDFWFEKGRVIIWKISQGFLFLTATLDISHAFLSLMIASNLEQLDIRAAGKQAQTARQGEQIPGLGDHLPEALLDQIHLELTSIIGPIARLVMSREFKKMGYSRNQFPYSRIRDLVAGLKTAIDTDRQEQFDRKITALIDRFWEKKK